MPKVAYDFIIKHKRVVMIVVVAVTVTAFSLISVIRFGGSGDKIAPDGAVTETNVNPNAIELVHGTDDVSYTAPISTMSTTTAATSAAETKENATKATQKPRSRTTATAANPVPFATAAVPAHPADYQAQWDAGYLLAIDNPDTSYSTSTVELSDADRDLLERLCMGEFGSGGFIGAALIAQAVKVLRWVRTTRVSRRLGTFLMTITQLFSTDCFICTTRIYAPALSTRANALF